MRATKSSIDMTPRSPKSAPVVPDEAAPCSPRSVPAVPDEAAPCKMRSLRTDWLSSTHTNRMYSSGDGIYSASCHKTDDRLPHIAQGMQNKCPQGTEKIYIAMVQLWDPQDIDLWIGRWGTYHVNKFTLSLNNQEYTDTQLRQSILATLRLIYQPIIIYVYVSHVVRTQLNSGQATHITGPNIFIGQFYNDISLPSGPIHNSRDPSVDSDWEDETPLNQGSEVRPKRRHRPQKKRPSIPCNLLQYREQRFNYEAVFTLMTPPWKPWHSQR